MSGMITAPGGPGVRRTGVRRTDVRRTACGGAGRKEDGGRLWSLWIPADRGPPGVHPVPGWLGPGLAESAQTPELLHKADVEYVCDWIADEAHRIRYVRATLGYIAGHEGAWLATGSESMDYYRDEVMPAL